MPLSNAFMFEFSRDIDFMDSLWLVIVSLWLKKRQTKRDWKIMSAFYKVTVQVILFLHVRACFKMFTFKQISNEFYTPYIYMDYHIWKLLDRLPTSDMRTGAKDAAQLWIKPLYIICFFVYFNESVYYTISSPMKYGLQHFNI